MTTRLQLVELVDLSDTGRVRDHNEDRALATPPLVAVADGMGGAQAGEVAAAMTVETMAELAPPTAETLRSAIQEANRAIRELAESEPDKAGMGTTVTAAMVAGQTLEILHVGDSRAYLWRDGELRQLTRDHSVVAELVRRGSLTPEDAENHPHRNVITRAVGAEPQVEIDAHSEELRAGDVILLCSDGLSSQVTDAVIAEELGHGSLAEVAQRLVERANAAGGIDNVTVVLARAGEIEETQSLPAVSETGEDAPGRSGDTREIRVVGGTRGRAAEEAAARGAPRARPPKVLEPVGRRRSRLRPVLLVGIVVLALLAAGTAWVASRSYFVAEDGRGLVAVRHGLPLELLGVALYVDWQPTSVRADAVRAAEPDALRRRPRGQGEAVELATHLVWRYGLDQTPRLAPPPARSPDRAGRAG